MKKIQTIKTYELQCPNGHKKCSYITSIAEKYMRVGCPHCGSAMQITKRIRSPRL